MRNECNIIRDILPLYAEKMVSPDTADFVEEHLKDCGECRREYERTRESCPARETEGALPLLRLSRKLAARRIQTVALTAVLVVTLLVSAFAVLDAPVYFPYSEGLITAVPDGEGGIRLTFGEEVTDFDYTLFYPEPDGWDYCLCEVQAWTSLWDRWFPGGRGKLSATVLPEGECPVRVLYVPNDGNENVWIYGEADESVSSVVLPRLSLGFYLFLAVAALAAAALVWLLTRRWAKVRVWTERIALYPLSYIVSHCIVSGFGTATYSLQRDFFLIIFISLLLYSGLLLAYSIRRMKKEIGENSRQKPD